MQGDYVLSGRALENLKTFLAAPAADYDPDSPRGMDPFRLIQDWALDPEYGSLPGPSARPFSDWLSNCWANWCDEEDVTVEDVLKGAVEEWCGGRVMPS